MLDATGLDGVELDPATGSVTAGAGVSIDDLLRVLVPRGWFVPVTPGTRQVTVGGALAADIHGKNHHRVGSWSAHVDRARLVLPETVVEVGPDQDPDLFWATAGGMGLTGAILDVTFRCVPIETSRLLVDTDRTDHLDGVLEAMADGDDRYDYSVAWIDLLARGRALGRSVLTRGRFAGLDDLPVGGSADPLHFAPDISIPCPPWVPAGLLNRASLRLFNEAWYHRAPVRRRDELQTIAQFFHPLDAVAGWNRLYGRRGFLQWQVVIPFGREATLRHVVERLSASRCSSFLAVLKRFGPEGRGPLSFPMSGWTLALDVPVGTPELGQLLDVLDLAVAEAGGRVYLAKDARMRPELLATMYPRLEEWRAVRRRVDPDRMLCSDLDRRLDLTGRRAGP